MGASLSIPMVLLAGIVAFASPCFLPVVPVFVGYMAGQDAIGGKATAGQGAVGGSVATTTMATRRATRTAAIAHAATFVAAFTLVFTALWALIGLVGLAVGDFRAILRVAGGAVLILLGLHLVGWIRIPLLDRTVKASYSPAMAEAPSYRRSFLLGLAFGAGWTPCVGPVLGGVLGLAASSESVGAGIGLLLVFSAGLGIPFVLVCAGASTVTARLSWFTRHHRGVAIASGALLMGIGFLMITDLFSKLPALTATIL